MIKKVFNILLSAVFILLCVTGCTSDSKQVKLDPDNPVSITIWHYYNDVQKTAFDQLITEFNETVGDEKGIIVEAVTLGGVNQLIDNIIDSANKKVGTQPVPNVFAAYADTAYQIDKLGLVVNLEDYLTQKEIEEYVPSYIEEGRLGSDNALKIFPTAKSTEFMMLNKTDWDKFSAATDASLDSLSTIEGLIDTAEKYYNWTDSQTKKPNDGKAFFGRDAMANYFIIGCKQLGCEIFSVKNNTVTFQTDKTVLRKLWDSYYLPYIKGYFTAEGKFRTEDAKTGDVLAIVGSSTLVSYFPTAVRPNETEQYPIEAVVLKAPVFREGEKYAVQQGAGMVVTKSTPEKELASVEFLKWFTEAERNLYFSALSGYLPVKKEANNKESLTKAIKNASEGSLSKSMQDALYINLETVSTSKLYTNRAFEGGTTARNVLENSLQKQASTDAKAVKKLIQNGMSRTDAIAKYNTDQNFENWYMAFNKELAASIQEK